ncbi:MAG: glycosyltransferase family 39 protein [Rhodocyclaceae bacterium]
MPAHPENTHTGGGPRPPRGWPLAVLLVLYILPGLFGHDPWKADDATAFGVAYDMLVRDSWLTPSIAGQTYPHAPLYFWITAASGKLFSWLLPLHDAVRLSSALFTLLILGFTHLAARALHGREYAVAAPLILTGSFGFLVHAHQVQPMLLTLAAHFAAYWALALLDRRPLQAGAIFGAALGFGLLGNGLASMALLLPVGAFAFIISENKRKTGPALLGSLLLASALALLWLLPLAQQAPQYLAAWWKFELDQLGQPQQPLKTALEYLDLLPWYAWPALPLAGWTLWSRRRLLRTPALALPLFSFFAILSGLCLTYEARSVSALLLLPPLVLLAIPGLPSLRRGAANAFDWFGMMSFTFLAALIWTGWCAMIFGWPERLAQQVVRLEPGFSGSFSALPFILALLVTAAWGWLIVTSPRSPFRGMTHWVAGVTLFWVLTVALWLPWVDYGKTYRPLSASLAKALPATHGCIAGAGLADALRASFDYFSGIVTVSGDSTAARRCHWLLTQGTVRADENAPGKGWHKVWEGNRPGDRSEKIRLYRRNAQGASVN